MINDRHKQNRNKEARIRTEIKGVKELDRRVGRG